MNELKALKNELLLEKTKSLVSDERRISVEVLRHLREIEVRKAYFVLNYGSLFDYAVSELKYSDASAMRRIQAMHALNDSPELEAKIEEGTLTVSGVARVQSFIRKEEKITNQKWDEKEKLDLYHSIENSSQREIEKTLVQISPKAALIETVKEVSEELSEVKIYLSVQELRELDFLRGLLAHQLKNPGSNSELIQKLIGITKEAVMMKKAGNKFVSAQSTAKNESKVDEVARSPENLSRNVSPTSEVILDQHSSRASPSGTLNRYIPSKIKLALFVRSNFHCEHIDAQTKVRCTSAFKLEIDHIRPYSFNGNNEIENLRVLCRAHNVRRNFADS